MVVHLLLQGFRVTPLPAKLSSKQSNWVANDIHFVIVCLCQKRVELSLYSCIIGWTLKNIHALLANL